ncbi:MAG: deoxyribose-phosphate aldolase [Ignavibacteria bacterium]|nr:deoxyribose-phosphate aldolase [Ignavibacteria bacterium]
MNIAATIDHTVLKPTSTLADVETICSEAITHRFASVCILPWHVERAHELLVASSIPVCTVVGFPLGASTTVSKVAESEIALRQGAREIDMVASITALKSGLFSEVYDDVREVTQAVHGLHGIVKVIIETCLLTDDEKKHMCAIVTQAGADFIKTSTGFSTGGATLDDVRLMRAHVGPSVKVKASGGIRDRETALAMLDAGAERLGTSSGVVIVSGLDEPKP